MLLQGPLVETAGKSAVPAGAFAFLTEIHIAGINLELVGAIAIGLVAGAIIRSSIFVSQEATFARIRRDLLVSLLAGLGNFIIAAILVALTTLAVPGFPTLAAAGVGMVVGFRGNDNVAWFAKKYVKLDVEDVRTGLYRASRPDAETPEDMRELARRLDEPKEGDGV